MVAADKIIAEVNLHGLKMFNFKRKTCSFANTYFHLKTSAITVFSVLAFPSRKSVTASLHRSFSLSDGFDGQSIVLAAKHVSH